MDDPTITIGFEFAEFLKSHWKKGGDGDSLLKEKEFLDFKKAVQDARLKSASCPSYHIMTINMNSPKSGVTEKRRRFVSVIMQSFFSSIIFCQELPGYFEDKVVAECGASGYGYVKNEKESAVLWRKEDFDGETKGLETSHPSITKLRDNLGSDASELLSRIIMVKLTSKATKQSVLAVSWHGPHKSTDDGKSREFLSLITFLTKVIENKKIPSYVIGGDFNLDTLQAKLPNDVAVANYELSPRQSQTQEKGGRYIPHKDNFIWFPRKKITVCYARPFLFEDKESTNSDFSNDDQAKVKEEMAKGTDTSPLLTDMLDHDPIIGVFQFTSSTAVRSLSEDLERGATADAEQH